MDISADFSTGDADLGRAVKLESYSENQTVLVPNENYWGDDKPVTEQIVIVPQTRHGHRDRLDQVGSRSTTSTRRSARRSARR